MKQMDMNGLEVVKVDYTDKTLPAAAKMFKPTVYKDGDGYCCLLGPDPQTGIFGRGQSASEAIADWDIHLQSGLAARSESEGIIRYIKERLEEIQNGDA
ncbi:MAG: hypothetical protein ACTHMM_11980 [Agriterribacter sp.]